MSSHIDRVKGAAPPFKRYRYTFAMYRNCQNDNGWGVWEFFFVVCENAPDVYNGKSGKLTMAAASDVDGKLKGHSTAIKTKLRVKWKVEGEESLCSLRDFRKGILYDVYVKAIVCVCFFL